jgi:hypothetical protein
MTILPIVFALNIVVAPPQEGQDSEVIMDNDTPPVVIVVNQDAIEDLEPVLDSVY